MFPDSFRLAELDSANVLGNDIYRISLRKININGLSPLALLNSKKIELDKLVLDSPEIVVTHTIRHAAKKDTLNLYDKISLTSQSYSIGSLLLNNIKLTLINKGKNKSVSSFKNLSAAFTDIKIDAATGIDTSRFLFAKDAVIFIKGFSQITPKKKYLFSIDSIAMRPKYGTLQFYNLRFKPGESKEQFMQKLVYGEDMFDIAVKSGIISNINWFTLIGEEGFFGDEMKISGGFLNVYNDKGLPAGKPRYKNFPHQKLLRAGFPMSLKKIFINDIDVVYEEFNPATGKSGVVEFKNVNGSIENFTNVPGEIKNNRFIAVNASASFMNEGKLNASFLFDIANAENGNFSLSATLEAMNGERLSKITEPLAMVKIKSLSIDKLQLKINGTNNYGKGDILFAYHNLSFDILKKGNEGELKKRRLLSFIANTFVVKKANPSKVNEQPKHFYILHKHEPHRPFFNLIWKTIFAGIQKTVK
jgi:hypothetical protein